MSIVRPTSGGEVALGDDDLARIGLAVVFEAAAKSVAASALRVLETLTEDQWKRLERVQFKQILERLRARVEQVDDVELMSRLDDLKRAVSSGHEARHVIVHVTWGAGGAGFLGYDYARDREVGARDIEYAVEGCAEIKRAASWFAMRVAELISEGVLPERQGGVGLTMWTVRGPVRL